MWEEPEFQKAIRDFDTLLLGDGPGDALGLIVKRQGNGVLVEYLVADESTLPPTLVQVPMMIPGYSLGMAEIWNKLIMAGGMKSAREMVHRGMVTADQCKAAGVVL
ncbi:MAG: hypothetical protein U5N55_05085 [Cypionkella sp.]|nr:hypothetical protein [Cypionkella sp.]